MSYQLSPGSTLPDALRQTLHVLNQEAQQWLQYHSDLPVAIHETRKCFKRTRAILRLIQKPLGKEVYRQESACYRDAGRRLSALRDAQAVEETLVRIGGRHKGKTIPHIVEKATVELRATRAQQDPEATRALLAEILQQIQAAGSRIDTWELKPSSFDLIAKGLARTYRRGRQALNVAQSLPQATLIHEWRKQLKTLWYQLEWLVPVWPPVLLAFAAEVHRLSEWLGIDHDLAVLEEHIQQEVLLKGRVQGKAALRKAIEKYHAELHIQMFPLGQRIYTADSAAFVSQMRHYWEIWQTENMPAHHDAHTAS